MGTLASLGYISRASYFPCADPNPLLFLQAAGNALYPTLLSAVSFSCLDIIKLRAGISPWHARGMRALVKGAIPATEADQINKIYKFLVPLEKALFFFFVVDLTTGFLANWQSQIFKLDACHDTPDYCEMHGERPSWVDAIGGRLLPVYWNTTQVTGVCNQGLIASAVTYRRDEYVQISWHMTFKPIHPSNPPTSCSMQLIKITGARQFPLHPFSAPAPWTGNEIPVSGMINPGASTHPPGAYAFYAQCDQPAYCDQGSISIAKSRRPLFNQGIIPINCFGKPAPGGNP